MNVIMKILKIQATGLKLFEKNFEIDFYAKQRVSADKNEMLTHIASNIYINNVISLVGINASGKTTTLKVISFVMQMLQNKPINTIDCNDVLDGLEKHEEVCFTIYFISDDNKLTKLYTAIKPQHKKNEMKTQYIIVKEKIWKKSLSTVRSKKDLFNFSNAELTTERNQEDLFLLDDVSIIVAFNKQQNKTLFVMDLIDWTNFNGLRIIGRFPIELVRFLDPSIEYLKCTELEEKEGQIEIRLKFYNKKEIIVYSPLDICSYLSSGTIKGLNIFMTAILTLKEGGYIIVDELENHFNKEIVSTLIKFFMDNEINKAGAVLVFSTHYIELLDIFDRNDNISVIKNRGGITIENLSDLLTRNDVKKSELFQSGYLEQTTPSYDSYINLKKALVKVTEAGEV